MGATTLGAGLAARLREHGVEVVFGVPGVHNVELYRGIEDAGITHILSRHEQGAGFMADGYARATGKPGVAFVISGPGLTNIMTPLGQAYSDSVPMLVVSSVLESNDAFPGQLHQMRDQDGAGACVADWSLRATDPEEAFSLLDRAFDEFQTRRKRPKHLLCPIPLLEGPSVDVDAISAPQAKEDDLGQLALVVELLENASKPMFILGGGAVGAGPEVNELLCKTSAASMTTYAGRGIVSPDNYMHLGACLARPESASILAEADLVIAVGTELAETDLWRHELGHRCKLVRIDIDEETLSDVHQADLRVKADAAQALRVLSDTVKKQPSQWKASEIARHRRRFHETVEAERPGIAAFALAMQAALPDDAMIYSDMTQFAYVGKEVCPMARPGHWHHPFGFGTLGYAVPAAIGGKIGRPDLPVVAIAGDYGLQYTLQELGVAAEMDLPLTIVLWDNGKLKEIEDSMVASQIAPNAVVAKNPDFEKLASAYGIGYGKIARPDELGAAVAVSLQANEPRILHVTPA